MKKSTSDSISITKGRWLDTLLRGGFAEEYGYVCSECGCTVSDRSGLGKYCGKNQQLNYCPNCGKPMEPFK